MTKDLASCTGDRSEDSRLRRSEKRRWRSDGEGVEVYGEGGRVGPNGNPREGHPGPGGSKWRPLIGCHLGHA